MNSNSNNISPNKSNDTPEIKANIAKKSSKKFFKIILIFCILGGVGYGYYSYKNSQKQEFKTALNANNAMQKAETIIRFLPKAIIGNKKEESRSENNSDTSNNLQVQYILIVKLLLDNIRENKEYEAVLDLLIILNNNKNITALLQNLRPFVNQKPLSSAELSQQFDNAIYEIAYLNYLSQDKSITGIASYVFHWLIFVKNRNVTNPQDIRYKLNSISNNMAKSNFEEALTIAKSLDKVSDYRVNEWIDALHQRVEVNKIRIAIESELNKYMNKG